jgi:hypothetical protein
MTPAPDHDSDRTRRLGRRAGIAVFSAIVTVITGVWSTQIILQVWDRPELAESPSCGDGLKKLISALDRAREAAATPAEERERIRRFRAALAPEWNADASLDRSCRDDAELSRALDEIRALRYEEEQAVRNPAAELAAKRRRVQVVAERVRGPSAEGPH